MGISEIEPAISGIKEFLYSDGHGIGNGNGYGHGYGSGYGNGNGYGNGSGNGYGHGNGSGNGNGYGYGHGYGNGSGIGIGYGHGIGNGSGYGSGNGIGNGYGNGIKRINNHPVYMVDDIPTIITHIKGNLAKGYILEFNVYLRQCYIIKHGRYFAHGKTIRKAREAMEEKIYANMDTEEAIERFSTAFGEADKLYKAKEFYVWHNRLTGSCEMGRKSFAVTHGIDLDNDYMTVREFIELTKDSFGGQVIRKLAEVYDRKKCGYVQRVRMQEGKKVEQI